jgi:nicotinamidase-related amidase
MGVQSLVIVGTVAQICVEETARESFHHGYLTTLVPDGLSSFAPDLQAATLRNFAMKFGWVADSPTVLSWLAANPERATLEGDLAAVVHRRA